MRSSRRMQTSVSSQGRGVRGPSFIRSHSHWLPSHDVITSQRPTSQHAQRSAFHLWLWERQCADRGRQAGASPLASLPPALCSHHPSLQGLVQISPSLEDLALSPACLFFSKVLWRSSNTRKQTEWYYEPHTPIALLQPPAVCGPSCPRPGPLQAEPGNVSFFICKYFTTYLSNISTFKQT